MKDYKILLISFVLLIFMIGAVSASDVDSSDSALAASDEDSIGGGLPMVDVIPEIDLDPGLFPPASEDDETGGESGGESGGVSVEVTTKEVYVNDTGDDDNLGTKESPYATVNRAFTDVNASNDATIHIGEGTFLLEGTVAHYVWDEDDYHEEWDEEINGIYINLDHKLYGGNVKFIGAGVDKTFLDGQSQFFFAQIGANSNVTIKDVTFINCNSYRGGAIYNNGNLIIENCVFKDSSSYEHGGAIFSEGSEQFVDWDYVMVPAGLTVTNSEFISCSAQYSGGAINSYYTNAYLENNTFINTTSDSGVAVYIAAYDSVEASLINNKFINLTGTGTDASMYLYGGNTAAIGNEFINCSNPSETYSIAYVNSGVFEKNIFINSTNSVGNIMAGAINTINVSMGFALINVSNAEINKGFKLYNISATDDMGNIVKVSTVTINLKNNETTLSRSSSVSREGSATFTFTQVPNNGIYELTLSVGNVFTSDVVAIVNITLNNDPVELWVSPDGFDGNDGTINDPMATIQHAIDVGFDNSFTVIIHLAKGTYSKDGNVQLTIANKGNLQIIGEKYNETIIDGEGTSWFLSVSTTNVNITNLKFINGKGQSKNLIDGGNSLYLENCIMDSNSARMDSRTYYALTNTKFDKLVYTNNQAQIRVSNCNITDSYFANNKVRNGNGILYGTGLTIKNSKFIDNTVEAGNGGAIGGSFTSIGNYYANNHADKDGGAVYITGKSKFVNDTFINNYVAENYGLINLGGAVAIGFSNNNPSSTQEASFEGCKFINNSADKGGAASVKIGKFNNCQFINNTAEYGGAFYLVPYIKVVEEDNNGGEDVLGAQVLPIVGPIPIIDIDITPVEEEVINSLILIDVTFENNIATFNGNDVYLEKPANWRVSDESVLAYGIPLTITFNDLNVTSLVDDLTATVYGPCGAVIGANYLTFELNGTKIGSASVFNSLVTFNYAGFEEGDYILSGTVEYPNQKNVVNSGAISVKLDNIVDHVDAWVSADGSDENGNGSQANPFKSISKAMSESAKNCRDITIHIGEGVYTGDLNTKLTISCLNNVTLIGDGMDKTFIDGEGNAYFAKITEGKNKIIFTNMTIMNMAPNTDKTVNPIMVEANSTLYLDTVNITGFKSSISGPGSIFVNNSVLSKNVGIIGSAGLLSIDNTLITQSYGSIGGNVIMNNTVIKDVINTGTSFTIISGKCIVENTRITNDCNNESLKEWGMEEVTSQINPAVAIDGVDVYLNNVSVINNYASPVTSYDSGYGAGAHLSAFGYLYGSTGKKVTVYNSSFTNFKYLWCVNTYGLVEFYFDGCLFDNITMIAQSQTTNAEYTEGINSSYVISNSVFINMDSVIDRFNRGDRPHPNCTFNDNYWGDNSKPVVTYVNCPQNQAPSFEPDTWVILVEEDGNLVFKVTDGENVTDYAGSLPAKISYVADENGDVIPVLNLAGTGYKLSVDENGSVVLNTTAPMKNIVPKVAVNETVFADDMTVIVNDGSKFTANFTDKWGDPLKNTNVSFKVGENTINATTDANGSASFDIDFALGEYFVVIANPVTGQSIDRTISVKAKDTTFASDVNATYGDASKFEAVFTDEFGVPLANANVTFKVGNDTVSAITDVNGTGSFIIDLDAGNYTVTAVNPATGQEVTKNIMVSPQATKLTASKLTMVYNTGKYLKATLTDANGKALANKKVTIKINGKTFNKVTNDQGQVSLKITLAVKTYTATITFAGDNNYLKSTASPKVVVKKATPKIVAKKKVTFKAKKKIKKFTITLKDNKGKVLKKAKVTLKIKGKKLIKVTTNKKGKATFKITKLTKKGKYIAKVKALASKNFKAKTVSVKITVKK